MGDSLFATIVCVIEDFYLEVMLKMVIGWETKLVRGLSSRYGKTGNFAAWSYAVSREGKGRKS